MKIALLYLLLIYQLLQSAGNEVCLYNLISIVDHILLFTVGCVSLQNVDDAIIEIDPGSNYTFYPNISRCGHSSNATFIFLHENHTTGELELISQQPHHTLTIQVQMNNSGIYCAYQQCAPQDKEKCCIRIKG